MADRSTQFSQAGFESALNTAFAVAPGTGGIDPVALRLVQVAARSAPPGFEQFSVLLVGPASPVMPQGTYRLVHEALGELDLFMVPVGRTGAGIEYEICITRDARGESA